MARGMSRAVSRVSSQSSLWMSNSMVREALVTSVTWAAPPVSFHTSHVSTVPNKALAHFRYINPLPKNALSELSRFKRVIVAELNTGMFADYLQMHLPGKEILRINKIEGQPFLVKEIVDGVKKHIAQA